MPAILKKSSKHWINLQPFQIFETMWSTFYLRLGIGNSVKSFQRKSIVPRVAAIFKSGKSCDSNNYRPISVLSIFSRVLEKIVHDQLHEFLKANGILTNNQYAFRKLYSTIMSLINSTEHWLENSDNRKLNMTVFLDLKKPLIR